jgi:hypothetical protein
MRTMGWHSPSDKRKQISLYISTQGDILQDKYKINESNKANNNKDYIKYAYASMFFIKKEKRKQKCIECLKKNVGTIKYNYSTIFF